MKSPGVVGFQGGFFLLLWWFGWFIGGVLFVWDFFFF